MSMSTHYDSTAPAPFPTMGYGDRIRYVATADRQLWVVAESAWGHGTAA